MNNLFHLKQKRDYFWQRNIRNAAVIVLDIGSGKILSAVSNFDNQLAKHEQQINALSARRPSGSTLKPFLFARSLEKGLITPKTLLEDIPTSFTGWSPQNFDENFRGLVNADLALTESLNIPFVKLLQKYGLSNFLHSFYQLPFGQAFFDQSHGLGSIIGGIDLSPLELASLYLALANNGLFGEISILETDQSSHRFQWISAQSALSVAEILKGHSQSQNFSQMIRDISWKTGTSHSRKDAWSIGFDKNHLVLVWLGNLKHESSPHLIGSLSAAPL